LKGQLTLSGVLNLAKCKHEAAVSLEISYAGLDFDGDVIVHSYEARLGGQLSDSIKRIMRSEGIDGLNVCRFGVSFTLKFRVRTRLW
jgi:hypothetical protein